MEKKLSQTISLDLRDMNVVDVYKFLAVKGNFNVSISKNIKGRVTLYLSDVTIRDTLDIITIANNLGYKFIGDNIIYVMTEEEYISMYGERFSDMREVKIVYIKYAKPAYVLETLKNIKSDIGKVVIDGDTGSVVLIDTRENLIKMEEAIKSVDHPLEMRIFNLRYADADDAAKKLKKELDNKSVGSVEADTRSNRLIVKAFPERMKEVEEMVKAIDVKTKAVLIDVQILKVTINPAIAMGVDWEAVFNQLSCTDIRTYVPFPGITNVNDYIKIAVGDTSQGRHVDFRVLKNVVATKVLASPSIMVVNNKEARIHIGDKLAYVTTTTIGAGDSQRTNEEIHYIDVGVQFKVTPTINEDGVIVMQIAPEISSRSGTLETPQGSEVPLINSTLVETSVISKDGQTIIIGGLKEDQKEQTRQGVPYLMDIPWLGKAFSSVSDSKTQTEIAILLTPHIVNDNTEYMKQKIADQRTIMADKTY